MLRRLRCVAACSWRLPWCASGAHHRSARLQAACNPLALALRTRTLSALKGRELALAVSVKLVERRSTRDKTNLLGCALPRGARAQACRWLRRFHHNRLLRHRADNWSDSAAAHQRRPPVLRDVHDEASRPTKPAARLDRLRAPTSYSPYLPPVFATGESDRRPGRGHHGHGDGAQHAGSCGHARRRYGR